MGISLAGLGWRQEEETLCFLLMTCSLLWAVLLGGLFCTPEDGKLVALMVSSILMGCSCASTALLRVFGEGWGGWGGMRRKQNSHVDHF